MQTIVEKSRSASLPLIRNQVDYLRTIESPSSSETRSSQSVDRLSLNQPFSKTFIPHPGKENLKSNTKKKTRQFRFCFVDCPDYNPYRNYPKYKAKRLRDEENSF